MKSALKNESKDTGCKNRDWNQGRSDFKPLWKQNNVSEEPWIEKSFELGLV